MPNLHKQKTCLLLSVHIFKRLWWYYNTLEIAIVPHTCYLTTGILNNVCLAKHNDFIV